MDLRIKNSYLKFPKKIFGVHPVFPRLSVGDSVTALGFTVCKVKWRLYSAAGGIGGKQEFSTSYGEGAPTMQAHLPNSNVPNQDFAPLKLGS